MASVADLRAGFTAGVQAAAPLEQHLRNAYHRELNRLVKQAAHRFARRAITAAANPVEHASPWGLPDPDEILPHDATVAALAKATDPTRVQIVSHMMGSALSSVGVSFNVTNPLAQDTLAQMGKRITNISDTTRDDIMASLQQSHAKGLSIPHTARAMQKDALASNKARATLIARTEFIGAQNASSLAVVQITGAAKFKSWVSTNDSRTRADHAIASGQTVPISQPFDVGGYQMDHPGDQNAPAREVCNCRCVMTFSDTKDGGYLPGGGDNFGGLMLAPDDATTKGLDTPGEAAAEADVAAAFAKAVAKHPIGSTRAYYKNGNGYKLGTHTVVSHDVEAGTITIQADEDAALKTVLPHELKKPHKAKPVVAQPDASSSPLIPQAHATVPFKVGDVLSLEKAKGSGTFSKETYEIVGQTPEGNPIVSIKTSSGVHVAEVPIDPDVAAYKVHPAGGESTLTQALPETQQSSFATGDHVNDGDEHYVVIDPTPVGKKPNVIEVIDDEGSTSYIHTNHLTKVKAHLVPDGTYQTGQSGSIVKVTHDTDGYMLIDFGDGDGATKATEATFAKSVETGKIKKVADEPASAPSFESGQIVQFKSGGPKFKVMGVEPDGDLSVLHPNGEATHIDANQLGKLNVVEQAPVVEAPVATGPAKKYQAPKSKAPVTSPDLSHGFADGDVVTVHGQSVTITEVTSDGELVVQTAQGGKFTIHPADVSGKGSSSAAVHVPEPTVDLSKPFTPTDGQTVHFSSAYDPEHPYGSPGAQPVDGGQGVVVKVDYSTNQVMIQRPDGSYVQTHLSKMTNLDGQSADWKAGGGKPSTLTHSTYSQGRAPRQQFLPVPKPIAGAKVGFDFKPTLEATYRGIELDPTGANAVREYSGNAYSSINKALRNHSTPTLAKQMDKVFDQVRPTTQPGIVYRGTNLGNVASAQGAIPGQVITEEGFTSTTFSPSSTFGGDTILEITIPKGSRVLDLNATTGSRHSSESEVLIARGARFLVTKVEERDGKRYLHVQLITKDYTPQAIPHA